MAEITSSTTGKRKRSFSGTTHQRSTRVDLTPMVDLGFLLITFFVFTTTMSQAMAMDMMEPKDGDEKPVPQSGAMTIILAKNHQLYYYYGILDEGSASVQIKRSGFKEIRELIENKKRTTDLKQLMYIIKADKQSTFGDGIDLLDEMAICDIPQGHYAETDITKAEERLINGH